MWGQISPEGKGSGAETGAQYSDTYPGQTFHLTPWGNSCIGEHLVRMCAGRLRYWRR
jgi:hypothetical protein